MRGRWEWEWERERGPARCYGAAICGAIDARLSSLLLSALFFCSSAVFFLFFFSFFFFRSLWRILFFQLTQFIDSAQLVAVIMSANC